MSWLTDITNALRALPRLEIKMGAVADALAGVSEKINKGTGEVLGRIDELEARLADAGKLDDADRAAIAAVRDAAQSLDDIVPDAVPETPAEEPAPEPVEPPSDLPPATA